MTHPVDLLVRYAEAALPTNTLVAVDEHLEQCAACRRLLGPVPGVDPDRVWAEIVSVLGSEMATEEPLLKEAGPVPEAEGELRTVPPRPVPTRRRWVEGRRWVITVAAAVVTVLLVGGLALLLRLLGADREPVIEEPEPTTTLATTTTAPPTSTTAAPESTATTTAVATSSGTTATGNLRLVAEVLDEPTEAPLAGVYVHKNLAFVGGMSVGYHTPENVGVRIVDLSDPGNPTLVGRIPLRSLGYGWSGDSDHSHGDAIATSLDTAAFVGDVAIVLQGVPDSFAPADYPEPYGLWDVTDPANPEFLSVINLGKAPHWAEGGDLGDKPQDAKAVAGTYFFALYDARDPTRDVHMAVVDISDPYNPQVVADWQDDPRVSMMGLTLNEAGTRAYLTGVWPAPYGYFAELGYVYVVDVADPTQPTLIGTYTFPLRGVPSSMAKVLPTPDETHVLLLDHSWDESSPGAVLILDITDLDNIHQVATFGPGGIATDVVVQGDLAFTTWLHSTSVRAIDISDPLNPTLVGEFTVKYDNRAWLSDVALHGDQYVVVSTVWEAGLYVLEVDETAPQGE